MDRPHFGGGASIRQLNYAENRSVLLVHPDKAKTYVAFELCRAREVPTHRCSGTNVTSSVAKQLRFGVTAPIAQDRPAAARRYHSSPTPLAVFVTAS